MGARSVWTTVGSAAFALCVASAVSAGSPPALSLDVGKTGAISGPYTDGGISLGLGASWRVEEAPWAVPIRFGVMAYFDDMGSHVDDLVDGSGNYIGLATTGHQAVFGGAFRLDYEPSLRMSWKPYASGTWGYYRIENDVRGVSAGGVSAPGFSLGAGIGHHLYEGHSIGLVVRYHRLFDDVTGRYVSGALEWGWRSGSGR